MSEMRRRWPDEGRLIFLAFDLLQSLRVRGRRVEAAAIGLRQRGQPMWWVKVKCPYWKRANSERWRVFEKPDAR